MMDQVFQLLAFTVGKPCSYANGGSLLGFPTWYHYVPGTWDANGICSPSLANLNDVWLVIAAIIEILLRIAGLIAVIMVIYGGFTLLTSQGEAEATKRGRNTVINALIGLAIAMMAAVIVSFIANNIS